MISKDELEHELIRPGSISRGGDCTFSGFGRAAGKYLIPIVLSVERNRAGAGAASSVMTRAGLLRASKGFSNKFEFEHGSHIRLRVRRLEPVDSGEDAAVVLVGDAGVSFRSGEAGGGSSQTMTGRPASGRPRVIDGVRAGAGEAGRCS